MAGNSEYREMCLRKGNRNPKFAADEKKKCAEDVLYTINTYYETFDSKALDPAKRFLPFITWDFQDDAILEIKRHFNWRDLVIDKTRQMGGSWMVIGCGKHACDYEPGFSMMMCSSDENMVDKTNDPKALFPKLDFIDKRLPAWLKPATTHRIKNHYGNLELNSYINGQATTEDIARGSTLSCVMLDEFAATGIGRDVAINQSAHYATNCRIWVSTQQGENTEFFRVSNDPIYDKLVLDWSMHPEKSKGKYVLENGVPRMCDSYTGIVELPHKNGLKVFFPSEYPFKEIDEVIRKKGIKTNGLARSLWVDRMCVEAANAQEVAQEIFRDALGSTHQFFSSEMLNALSLSTARAPLLRLPLDQWLPGAKGELCLYQPLIGMKPARGNYGFGIDVAFGFSASESTLAVVDLSTGEKVADFSGNEITPEQYAEVCVSLAKWYHGAYMVWDAGGPGHAFGARVMKLGYRNVYWKQDEANMVKKASNKPGFFITASSSGNGAGSKQDLMVEFRRALTSGAYTERNEAVFNECKRYIFRNGTVEHSQAAGLDPSAAKGNHGDKVIAAALAWFGYTKRGAIREMPKDGKTPEPSVLKGSYPRDSIQGYWDSVNKNKQRGYALK